MPSMSISNVGQGQVIRTFPTPQRPDVIDLPPTTHVVKEEAGLIARG